MPEPRVREVLEKSITEARAMKLPPHPWAQAIHERDDARAENARLREALAEVERRIESVARGTSLPERRVGLRDALDIVREVREGAEADDA